MKTIVFLFTLFPFYAMALTLAGQVSIDGEDFEFKKKISLGKESVFPMNSFLYKVTVIRLENKKYQAKFNLFEKDKLVTKGEEFITGEGKYIYAKGEQGQPNSIITLKILNK